MLKFTSPYSGREMDCALVRDQYVHGGGLYVGLWTYDKEDNFWEPWCEVTTSLPGAVLTDENCGFVDTNNADYLPEFLEKNGLGTPTGRTARSGFCTYPEFRFDIQKLDEHLLVIPHGV